MSDQDQRHQTLWTIANQLRGAMNAEDFRDYMLAFLFLRYLSDNYEKAAKKELGNDYPDNDSKLNLSPLFIWYEQNANDVLAFEMQMRLKTHYVIHPKYIWSNISKLALTQDSSLLDTLQKGFRYIENESFESTFSGLFSEINLNSEKLGKDYMERNKKLCSIISELAKNLTDFSTDSDALGDAYEYLIGQFAADSGKKAGEFYTPQGISDILSGIVMLDSQEPRSGQRKYLTNVMDFACGSGSLLLNIRKRMGAFGIGKLFGQEKNITTYNLARMNMLLHGVKDTEFEIYHGDTLTNDWKMLRETNPAKKNQFDAVVANPPFSYRWDPREELSEDMRFKNYGLAPKSAADFAFLLHGFHYLKDDGVMAIILPHGVLFRGGTEAKIRRKLLEDGNIDTVIGLAANLFYSAGIQVCILILKKCRKTDDILFINASEHFKKEKRQNYLSEKHIKKIVETYKQRPEYINGFARCVRMDEIKANDYNLNIPRYVGIFMEEIIIDLVSNHRDYVKSNKKIGDLTVKHNTFLKELGLPPFPVSE